MKYIFLDTNIFIHFKYFEEIPWQDIINYSDFTIVLAPTVLDELDNHKYNQNRKVSKRVKELLPKLEKIIDKSTQCKVKFQYLSITPKDETFNKNRLSKEKQDDTILASILEFCKDKNIEDVYYISYDTAPRLKAKTFNINALKLSDNYLSKEELDENDKKIKILEKQVNDFQNSLPKIKLTFNNNKDFLNHKLPDSELNEDNYIQTELNDIKKNNPYLTKNNSNDDFYKNFGFRLPTIPTFLEITEYQISEYNKSLDLFFDEYKGFLSSKFIQSKFLDESIKFNLKLLNEGTQPAKKIELYLYFPDSVEIYDENNIPQIIDEPKPPYKPKNSWDYNNLGNSDFYNALFPKLKNNSFKSKNYEILLDKNQVTFFCDSLMHNKIINLDTIYVRLKLLKGFSIKYTILVENLPNKIDGQLHIKIVS